jgi:hypothetical protein
VRARPSRYQVTLEPSDTRWLFALEMPQALPQLPGTACQRQRRARAPGASPVRERMRYDLAPTWTTACSRRRLPDDAYQWLLLPYGRNPRRWRPASALRPSPDPARACRRCCASSDRRLRLHAAAAAAGRDAVDEFLYGTRAGFCEHYAGAFVFLMRAAGVPARVVTGYQGGELNPIDGYLTVRQSDAHAWAEVWLPKRGWVRIDPTAAVAPDRVRRSLARALPPPAPFGFEAWDG